MARKQAASVSLLLGVVQQLYVQIGNADEVLLIEVAHSAFKHLFAYVEHAFNVFGLALIAKGARAAMLLQILQQGIGKVEGVSATCRL